MRFGLSDRAGSPRGRGGFPVQSSVLDEETLLSEVLPLYSIPAAVSCRFLTRGDTDIYRVRTGTAAFYLKIYRPPQSIQRTEAEAGLVSALIDSGVPAVKPVPRTDGSYAARVEAPEGRRPLLLFEAAPPSLPQQLDEGLVREIGEVLAMVHASADEFDTDFGVPALACGEYLKERSGDDRASWRGGAAGVDPVVALRDE